jgi:hypothetical protein
MSRLNPDTSVISIEDQPKTQRLVKIDNSPKFSNGVNPTFDNWYLAIISKFRINADHFASEDARIYQIYIYIKENVSNYLYPRYESDAANLFKTAQKIMDYFK